VRAPRRTGISIRRIVVAADSSAPGRTALGAAVRLAQQLQAELEGLFVEDVNLRRLAELPVAREIRFGSGFAQPLGGDTRSVADDLRAEAARLRRAFEEATQRARVHATFRVAEGRLERAMVEAGGDADLLVIGLARQRGFAPLAPGAAPASLASRPLVLYDGSEGAERALDLAARLADDDAAALTVVIRAVGEAETLRLRRRAAQLLAARDHGAQFRSATDPSLADLCRAVSTYGASALVISGTDALLAEDGFRRLLADVVCPVLVVR
jgi:nucleotide-binding universal stress UspA family protein